MKRPPFRLLAVSFAAAAFAGCSSAPKPQPLSPEAFINPHENSGDQKTDNSNTGGGSVGDNARPAVQIPGNVVSDTINQALGRPAAPPARDSNGITGTRPNIADVVENEIKPVAPVTSATGPAMPGAGSTSLPAIGASSGQYMTLGGVVADVNGRPIYANRVIALLDVSLRQKARQLDARNYERQAMDDIRRQISELIRNELEYAAAERHLDLEDRHLADSATIYWRMQQITKAGGSLELARRASLADRETPMDFDERTAEQSRLELIKIYYNKKVYPKIQVGAKDIRDYYDRNVDKEFTENERVKFRIIEVLIGKTGSKEKALEKIAYDLKRAKAGEDFTEMAMRENDETMFAGKEPFDIAPGSFSIAPVREALTKLKPGEVSEILEDKGAYYIVKLESRVGGRVRPFEEQKVQDEIRTKLRSEQFRTLREQGLQSLVKDASINTNDQMALIALDMAMQRYALYAAAK
jgi:hypothetical protein